MKVCVVGMGAVGGLLAGWIGQHLPEVQLSALARGATLEALRLFGVRLHSGNAVHSVKLQASDQAQTLGPQDLVIVAVKGPALAAVADAVRLLCHDQTTVLVAMNGVPWWFFQGLPGACEGLALQSVDAGGHIAAAIPIARVVGAVVHLSSVSPEPGLVRHGSGNSLIIGEPAGGVSPRVTALETLLARAGINVTVSERIQRDIWFKLWGNMTMNPISALTGATADRVLDDPLVREFACAVMLEAREIGARIGIPITQEPEDRHVVTRKLGAFKTSMLQDLEAGRPLELDALVTAVREIGQRLGLATPHIDALLGLTRLMAQQRGLYPLPSTAP
jgi:2-dehydropantoate 2-reductase